MIKDFTLSKEIISTAIEVDKKLMSSLHIVEAECSEEEFLAYRKAIATLSYDILKELIQPISHVHPELNPLKNYNE